LEYTDLIYELAGKLPKSEEYNLKSQIVRAATSISLNIAEAPLDKVMQSKQGF
jgi:four helix bundle protein